jgi:hypothetical protein
MKLYELATAYQNLSSLLEDEIIDPAVLGTALQEIETQIEVKCENIAILMKGLDAEAEMFRAEEKRLSGRRRTLENKRDWLKGYLQAELEKMGLEKVKAGLFTVALQNNPPAVEITGEVPAEFVTIIPEQYQPDKKRIGDFLKAGNIVEWAQLKQGKSLRVR